jgi:hypothetical protein
MTLRPLRIAILALSGLLGASGAQALGIGRLPQSIRFGQPLDLAIPLRIEAGTNDRPGCPSAEVSVGEKRVPASDLQVSIEPDGSDDSRLHLRSAVVVLEPLVTVRVSLGCEGVVSKQFVVFADPPAQHAQPATAAVLGLAQAQAVGLPAAVATPLPAATAGRLNLRNPARAHKQAGQPGPGVATVATRANAAPVARQRTAAQRVAPRLKLEEPEALLQAATLAVAAQDAAVASAERSADAAQAAASAAQARLLALQTELQAFRADATASRASLEQLRLRLASADDQGRFVGLLAAMTLALAALAAWLAWRVKMLQRERQLPWTQLARASRDELATLETALPPFEPDTAPAGAALPTPARDWIAASSATDAAQVDEGAGPALRVQPLAHRALSVDELIDLEQQAEFFLVLGEEESAIDLLMAHLRSTGGVSPLPYLKLLEIFRRRLDREAYERLRERFNLRFNAVAPAWSDDPERGRELQDYPRVVAALQAAWPQPLDAMTELENLLFRKRGGELFELPAYRDVLSLYAVARDLHRHVDLDTVDVDLLLPLGPLHEGESTAPLSIVDRLDDAGATFDMPAAERPTAPIDLDLSEPEPAASRRAAAVADVGAALRRVV